MKKLLTLVAIAEGATGVALTVVPSLVGRLLLGAELSGVAAVVGRVAGIALFALGIACWLARTDTPSRAAKGLVAAMLFYNFAVAAFLAFAGLDLGLRGVMLWPAVILHAAMAVWCVACLLRSSINVMD
jgi:hypothetical protein